MDLTQLRRAIGEAMGATWQEVPPLKPRADYLTKEFADSIQPKRLLSFHTWQFDHPRCAPIPLPDGNKDADDLPQFCESLDAIDKAKRKLLDTREKCDTFNDWLMAERPALVTLKDQSERWSWGQTARTQARALAKTIGIWIE